MGGSLITLARSYKEKKMQKPKFIMILRMCDIISYHSKDVIHKFFHYVHSFPPHQHFKSINHIGIVSLRHTYTHTFFYRCVFVFITFFSCTSNITYITLACMLVTTHTNIHSMPLFVIPTKHKYACQCFTF